MKARLLSRSHIVREYLYNSTATSPATNPSLCGLLKVHAGHGGNTLRINAANARLRATSHIDRHRRIAPVARKYSTTPCRRQTHTDVDTTRTRPDLPQASRAFIALGSNVGDRLGCIEEACRMLDAEPGIRIMQTSALRETKAMYVEDQDPFLNGACMVATSLSPIQLLDRTQAIENQLGRVKTVDKGPRSIDLDILLFDDVQMATERLTIPHPLMLERDFVLDPLSDMPAAKSIIHPVTKQSIHTRQPNITPNVTSPLAPECPAIWTNARNRATRIMAILNITPDSFSDGGKVDPTMLHEVKLLIRHQIASGATILDIGGQSSRPNAPAISSKEEIRRILPIIDIIKTIPEAARIPISVDTYRAAVAEAAVKAGAHIVNDISAGQLDEEMLPTVARLGCTYVMMHMRGTPETMQNAENCKYPNGLTPTIAAELMLRVEAAQEAGIRRWRIILDPGIGFSKTTHQNLQVLRSMRSLRASTPNYPWLLGSSRKSFIGEVTNVSIPRERTWGTAATVSAAVQGGADIVRVHDVKEMAAVTKMADAIYRGLHRR